ncbi:MULTISPECIES: hypothetical protein [unclassified Microbacterium]|nr:hypothetical protein [Microbacterium sp. MAH-37]
MLLHTVVHAGRCARMQAAFLAAHPDQSDRELEAEAAQLVAEADG